MVRREEATNGAKESVEHSAKPRIDFVVALVVLFTSLAALLLVQLRENENALHYQGQGTFIWESWYGDSLIMFTLGLAVLASLVLVAVALVRRVPRSRSGIDGGMSRLDPTRQYPAAAGTTWVDKESSESEKSRLGRLEGGPGLSREWGEPFERGVMGATREEVEPPRDEPEVDHVRRAGDADRYRIALKMAWADGNLNGAEKELLGTLESALGLSRDRAAELEREVLGGTREEVKLHEDGQGSEDEAWERLVEECVGVVDELDRNMAGFDPVRQGLAEHVILRMEEVLERSGVEIISDEETFHNKRHKPETASSRVSPGAAIAETLSPGFAVGRRVLRRARVRVE